LPSKHKVLSSKNKNQADMQKCGWGSLGLVEKQWFVPHGLWQHVTSWCPGSSERLSEGVSADAFKMMSFYLSQQEMP
jgi:hypothetical protein